MAHHHNIVKYLKTSRGYLKHGEGANFTDNREEARRFGYWELVWNRDETLRKLGLSDELINTAEIECV